MKRKLRGFKRSAIELDFNLYRVSSPLAGVPNQRLSVIEIRPEAVERTIVFVHGYAGCAETWEHQINYFSKTHRVVAPDLRGHGQSDAPYTNYTMDELVGDLYLLSQHLNMPEKFVLVGHSFGGSISVEYANAHPEQVERLILVATAGEWPLPKIAYLPFRLPTAVYRPLWKYRGRWNAEVHVFKRMMMNNLRTWQGWPLMRNLSVPTMIITGERDNYFPRYVYDDVGKMVPNAELVDVGASKHKVQLERQAAVNRAIERFISDGTKLSSWRSLSLINGLKKQRPWLDAYAEGTPHTVPIPERPMHEFLYSAADSLPNHSAIVFYNSQITYKALVRAVNRFAYALQGLGVAPGDRVMITLPNVPDFIISYYGTLAMGGVVVLPNPDASPDEIARQADQTKAKILVTLRQFSALARLIYEQSELQEVIFIDLDQSVPPDLADYFQSVWGRAWSTEITRERAGAGEAEFGVSVADLTIDKPFTRPEVEVPHDALAAVLYTSGTTTDPRGVCLSHSNLVANAIQIRHWVPDLSYGTETFLTVVPLLHCYGMTMAMNLPIAAGAKIILVPKIKPREILEQIKQNRPTIFMAVPSIYGALAREPEARSYSLGSIKACISGSAPLPVEIQEAFEKLTHGRLVEGYGLTEASPATHANPLYGRRKVGSIGVPIPNTDARIVDLASGEDLPPGQIGQLLVKGPQVTNGYYGRPSETRVLLSDGWLDTGDVALMDSDGYFQIIGRTRDVIRAGEHTIYPRDIEELLYENSKVHEVAVIGVPQTSANQKVKAFVVPRPGTTLSKEELLALCQRRLEHYAVPWEIEFRAELPKTFSGKIIRRLLVEEK